jgi:hypothetical protein
MQGRTGPSSSPLVAVHPCMRAHLCVSTGASAKQHPRLGSQHFNAIRQKRPPLRGVRRANLRAGALLPTQPFRQSLAGDQVGVSLQHQWRGHLWVRDMHKGGRGFNQRVADAGDVGEEVQWS